ncbi:BON domain-containing protein [Paraburkholderia fynbosensis]|uniref:BON domain-containing protein n=1 Tax=Paraburkholderia fynbosensis TaxID=1200993 RepID=UPI001582646C|nr:BON domain-containing protein [Paraburkholderia fynbosensis]
MKPHKPLQLLSVGALLACLVANPALGQHVPPASDSQVAQHPADASDASNLESAKATKAANRALGRKVRQALAKAQGLDVSSVVVRARGGAVTLSGSVPDSTQIDKASEAAKGVAGVKSVENKLTIQQQ